MPQKNNCHSEDEHFNLSNDKMGKRWKGERKKIRKKILAIVNSKLTGESYKNKKQKKLGSLWA